MLNPAAMVGVVESRADSNGVDMCRFGWCRPDAANCDRPNFVRALRDLMLIPHTLRILVGLTDMVADRSI